MPNDCYNALSIDANDALIERIMNHVRSEETEFDFEKIVPMPENIYRGMLGSEERKLYGENNYTYKERIQISRKPKFRPLQTNHRY